MPLEGEMDKEMTETKMEGLRLGGSMLLVVVWGVLTLTWYTYMCLPFGALFREIWYSDWRVFIRDKEAQLHKLGVFWANYYKKAPNLAKIGCFSFENGILMGGKLGKKLV